MSAERYGNKKYWCFIEDDLNKKEIAIWKSGDGAADTEVVIARATDKYEAKIIVDALLNFENTGKAPKFGKRELTFLEFVSANCVEPYSTMADNAMMWDDFEIYDKLMQTFPSYYK